VILPPSGLTYALLLLTSLIKRSWNAHSSLFLEIVSDEEKKPFFKKYFHLLLFRLDDRRTFLFVDGRTLLLVHRLAFLSPKKTRHLNGRIALKQWFKKCKQLFEYQLLLLLRDIWW